MEQDKQSYGTCKVKDGLYIGDEYAAKDLEFIMINKIGFVINTTSEYVQNYWESIGVVYVSFQMSEHETPSQQLIDQVYNFIEESAATGQSCLIHSVHGQSRACSIVAIYLMRKYNWALYKTLEFLNSRRNDLEIKTTFFQSLGAVEQLFSTQCTLTHKWDVLPSQDDEALVRNTYLNALANAVDAVYTQPEEYSRVLAKEVRTKIQWTDHPALTQPSYRSILKGSKLKREPKSNVRNLSAGNMKTQEKTLDQQNMNITFALNQNTTIPVCQNIHSKQPLLFENKEKENIPPLKKATRSASFITTEYDKQADMIRRYLKDNQTKQFNNYLEEPNDNTYVSNNKINPATVKPAAEIKSAKNLKQKQKTDTSYKPHNNIPRNKSNSVIGAVHKVNSLNNVAKPLITLRPRMPNFEDPQVMKKNIDITGLVQQMKAKW